MVSGGFTNEASGSHISLGGEDNIASGDYSSVSAGLANEAAGHQRYWWKRGDPRLCFHHYRWLF